jgi:hypothetical protein
MFTRSSDARRQLDSFSPLSRPSESVFGVGSVPRRSSHWSGSPSVVVLQVDAAVSRCHGLAWLIAQRESSVLGRLSELQARGIDEGWSADEFTRARLAALRPRRAEINLLGRVYVEELAPGVVEAVRRIRRAGIALQLSGEVAIEALFGVAAALDVAPDALRGPALRFDALGAYRGCAAAQYAATRGREADASALYVGTTGSDLALHVGDGPFLSFTGYVMRDGVAAGPESVSSFGELAALVGA